MHTTVCRLCGENLSAPVVKFPDTPLANEFLSTRETQETFPLQICACIGCGHFQLNEAADPERLFRHYVFVAGTSPTNVEHFKRYAESMVDISDMPKGSKVLDIASNDGTLLKQFKQLGMTVLGIDPAENIAKQANDDGIETLAEFFSDEFADTVLQRYGQFDLITANNVMAHVPDIKNFAQGVKKLLSPKGIFTFEVSYFKDVVDKTLFDTVYHEHSSYHTVTPLVSFFKKLNMDLFRVDRIDTHGGSIRVFVQRDLESTADKREISKKITVEPLLREEKTLNASQLQTDVRLLGLELREILRDVPTSKSIAVYGTPAKATTLLYALKVDTSRISYAVDDNPLKQNTYIPGNHIPVLPSSELQINPPDYILILAWNFSESIIQKCRAAGYAGKFIVPLPELKVM